MELKHPTKQRKVAAPRERSSETKRISYEMYKSGKSLPEIAQERSLALTTVEAHISYFITAGELDVNRFVPADKQELIKAAIEKFGKIGLRTLKDNLPEEISYGEIRMVVAAF